MTKKDANDEFQILSDNVIEFGDKLKGSLVKASKNFDDDNVILDVLDELQASIILCDDPLYFIDKVSEQLKIYIETLEFKSKRKLYYELIDKSV